MGIEDKFKSSHEAFSRAMKERQIAKMLKEASEIVVLGEQHDTLKVRVVEQKPTYAHVGYGVTQHVESGRIYGQAPYMKSYHAKRGE
jgi:hypothetical protein